MLSLIYPSLKAIYKVYLETLSSALAQFDIEVSLLKTMFERFLIPKHLQGNLLLFVLKKRCHK